MNNERAQQEGYAGGNRWQEAGGPLLSNNTTTQLLNMDRTWTVYTISGNPNFDSRRQGFRLDPTFPVNSVRVRIAMKPYWTSSATGLLTGDPLPLPVVSRGYPHISLQRVARRARCDASSSSPFWSQPAPDEPSLRSQERRHDIQHRIADIFTSSVSLLLLLNLEPMHPSQF